MPHWVAEYGTALTLLIGASGLLFDWNAGRSVALVALGGLAYTSVNSLGWVLADRSRLPYGVPMLAGLVGALISIIIIF